ncbi:uncharacterized protein PG998_005089 [Apiospora kogelbergensis]|uniref:Uncharacterized protein n=1 Tax=Apiospora kogelbergensis TaxID=1337665 RepID=A0AAW0QHY2_9PEZI
MTNWISGRGGGRDLPSIKEVLASGHSFGTCRCQQPDLSDWLWEFAGRPNLETRHAIIATPVMMRHAI